MNEQSVFHAALEIADSRQRAEYLDRACFGDEQLRRQVEALIEAHERSGEFLDVPALRQMAGGTDASNAEVNTSENVERVCFSGERHIDLSFLEPPDSPDSLGRLGHYNMREVLGHGGCGIVLKALDEKLERVVAVKVMAPELAATSPARQRFLREARANAAIRHENVVGIFAVEEQPLPFLVMEFISGMNLQQKSDAIGPFDVRDVLRIGRQIASGLAAAHDQKLIHRDIKPANVLLEPGDDRVKITDFGLARSADDASVTQSGVIAGTPMYMSPEQAQGLVIDHRSDLFSLGSVLYLMCSGRPPFRAHSTLAVLKRVVEEEPRSIRDIIPDVPDWLEAIINKLHAKDPEQRFATAREVAELLSKCQTDIGREGGHGLTDDVRALIPRIPDRAAASARQEGLRTSEFSSSFGRSRSARGGRIWRAIGVSLLVLLIGLALSEAVGFTQLGAVVMSVLSPKGTLVVEIDDPDVRVTIDGTAFHSDSAGAKEIQLKPGKYNLQAHKDGKLLSQQLVAIIRNGRQVVRVSVDAEPAASAPEIAATPSPINDRSESTPQDTKSSASAAAESDEGFVPLFNRHDLSGWVAKRSATIEWKNENGTITGHNRSSMVNSGGQLTTEKHYKDFHFRCEVLAGSGAGQLLMFRDHDTLVKGARRGYAVTDPALDSPLIAEGWGHGSLYADDFQAPAQESRLASSVERDLNIKPGDWYRLEFIAVQETVEVRINGKRTAIFTSASPALNRAGTIAIRCGAGASVTLRNLEIKDLTADAEDPFQPMSVWVDDEGRVLTVTERRAETFRAIFKVGSGVERDVSGTIQRDKLSWLEKDVRVIKGKSGGDNYGAVVSEGSSYRIDFVWRHASGASGNFTLRLYKPR